MFYILLLSFITVFTGELLGDKLLYTVGALAARYRMAPVLSGVAVAFVSKMAAAVLLGGFVARMPAKIVAVISAATFFTMALALTFKAPERAAPASGYAQHWFKIALVAFSVVFFSEWGDIGQITAATLSARYHLPFVVWLGGTLAMLTKAVLAMTAGVALRNRVSQEILRYCGVSLLFGLGLLSLINAAL